MQGPGQAGKGKESASGTYRSCQNQTLTSSLKAAALALSASAIHRYVTRQ